MIPIVKGKEPAALTKAKRAYATPPIRRLISQSCAERTSEKFWRPCLQSRAIAAFIARAGSALVIVWLRLSIYFHIFVSLG